MNHAPTFRAHTQVRPYEDRFQDWGRGYRHTPLQTKHARPRVPVAPKLQRVKRSGVTGYPIPQVIEDGDRHASEGEPVLSGLDITERTGYHPLGTGCHEKELQA